MSERCQSQFKISAGTYLTCAQHLGSSRRWKHSARSLGIRWYWTTAEAEQQREALSDWGPHAGEGI